MATPAYVQGAEIFAPCRQYSCTMRWLIRVLTILFLSLFLY